MVTVNKQTAGKPTYIGIDPGASGGLAWIYDDVVEVVSTPVTEQDTWAWFHSLHVATRPWELFAVIEKVGGFMAGGANGGNKASGHTMFTFGQSYGSLRMALIAAEIPFEEVTPQAWQKGLSIPKKAKTESRVEWKNRLKAKAQQLFPQEKVTLATADALLIAEFCRRKREGKL